MENLIGLLTEHHLRCRKWGYFALTASAFALAPLTAVCYLQGLSLVAGIAGGFTVIAALSFFVFFINALGRRWRIHLTQTSLVGTALVAALLAEFLTSPFAMALDFVGVPAWIGDGVAIGAALGLFLSMVIGTVAKAERQTHLVSGFLVVGGTLIGAFVLLMLNKATTLLAGWMMSVAS